MTDYSKMTDGDLIALTLMGDERAFAELVVRHEKYVMGIALRITGNLYSAQDASQDAFISAWIKLDSLSDPGKFRPWINRIAGNSARNIVKHYRAVACDLSLDEELLDDLPDLSSSESAEVHEMVGTLDPAMREVLELHYFEGYSVAEIAEKLGQPAGTVKWRLSEARKQLRKGYGAMEEYNEKEELVRRVMRQVEKLKLWRLKEDKHGFNKEYREVLANVNSLDDSAEKDNALAEVMMMAYWWSGAYQHKTQLNKIKKIAEKTGNEQVMADIAYSECMLVLGENDRAWYDESEDTSDHEPEPYDIAISRFIDKFKNEVLPYYVERGMRLAQCRVYLEIIKLYYNINSFDEIPKYLELILHTAPEDSHLYRAAAGMLDVFRMRQNEPEPDDVYCCSSCYELREIDGKLCLWSVTGKFFGNPIVVSDTYAVTSMTSPFDDLYDGVIYDPEMEERQTVKSSSGTEVTLVGAAETVEVPAGRFEGCKHFRAERKITAERKVCRDVWYCPGVGIVKVLTVHDIFNRDTPATVEIVLASYRGGFDGLIPRAGSRWDYSISGKDLHADFPINSVEVFGSKDGIVQAVFKLYAKICEFEDSREGDFERIKHRFYSSLRMGKMMDLSEFDKALERDITPCRRTFLEVARRTAKRIFETTNVIGNGGRIADGLWNWFNAFVISRDADGVTMTSADDDRDWISWTPFRPHVEGQKLLHNHFVDILSDSTGFLWNEKWIPGYSEKYLRDVYGMKDRELDFHFVKYGETVTVPAGTFENCVHIQFDMRGLGNLYTSHGYRGGWADYWFAPGIGLIQHYRLINNTFDCYWQLTDYRGTGEGYFPAKDGLWRRYEPADLKQGFISSLELTFAEEDGVTYMFADGEGSQLIEEQRKEEKERGKYEVVFDNPKNEQYKAVKNAAKEYVEAWDPRGFLADGAGSDSYYWEIWELAQNAVYGNPKELSDYEKIIEKALSGPNVDVELDPEKVRELAQIVKAANEVEYVPDDKAKENVRIIETMFLGNEFTELIDRGRELLKSRRAGENALVYVLLTVKRNIYPVFVPDINDKAHPAENELADKLKENNDTGVLRLVCMHRKGQVERPSAYMADLLRSLNESNGFTAFPVMMDHGLGLRRLCDK